MCINAVRTSAGSFSIRNLAYLIIKNKCFNLSFEKCFTFGTCSWSSVAAEESSNLRPYI